MRRAMALAVAVLAAGSATFAAVDVARAASDLRQNLEEMAEVRAGMRRDRAVHEQRMAEVRADMAAERARVMRQMRERVPQ